MTIIEDRKRVAELLRHVRLGDMHVRDALLAFPDSTDDKSVMAAYHALVHYEADEDLRKRDKEYKEEQDLYLKSIADILLTGSPLPENIINSYEKFYNGSVLPEGKGFKNWIKSLFRFIT